MQLCECKYCVDPNSDDFIGLNDIIVPVTNLRQVSDDEMDEIRRQLDVYGFCGVQTLYSEVSTFEIADWVDRTSQGKKISAIHGIIKHYGVGQSPFMWKCRDWLYPLFSKFWGTSDLICSFDGANFYTGTGRERTNPRSWLHRDQRPEHQDFRMIQGVMQLVDNTDGNGCLVVVPESHRIKFEGKTSADWFRIPENIPCQLHYCRNDMPTLWLFDSRLWHANSPPAKGLTRVACYVTFAPNPHKAVLTERRKRLVENGETTSHWPTKTAKNGSPRYYHSTEDYVNPKHKGETVKFEDLKYKFK
jgi:hypothetical protein